MRKLKFFPKGGTLDGHCFHHSRWVGASFGADGRVSRLRSTSPTAIVSSTSSLSRIASAESLRTGVVGRVSRPRTSTSSASLLTRFALSFSPAVRLQRHITGTGRLGLVRVFVPFYKGSLVCWFIRLQVLGDVRLSKLSTMLIAQGVGTENLRRRINRFPRCRHPIRDATRFRHWNCEGSMIRTAPSLHDACLVHFSENKGR